MADLRHITQKIAQDIRTKHAAGELPVVSKVIRPLTPCRPNCPVCQGKGWFIYDVPRGHPEHNIPHVCPHKPVSVAGSGLSVEDYGTISWEDILPEGNAAEAIDAVMAVIERGYGWVYLYGKPGRAKTLILQRAVKEALDRNMSAQYAQTEEVLGWLRASFDEERKQFALDTRLERLSSQKVLALDEFDRFNNTVWANSQVFRIMNDRYVSALHEKTVTLMGSNSSPAVYDDYLQDRLYDGRFQVVHLSGDSLRPAADWSMP